MGKKNKLKKPTLAGSKTVIGFSVVMLLLFVGMAYLASHIQPARSRRPDSPQIPIYFERAEDAMPFPATLDPARFVIGQIRDAYQVAKDAPGVLAQQSCYCYCQRRGHRSLLDCFASTHATSCDICIKEGLLAGQMNRQGKTAEEIRAAIIQDQWANVRSSR